MVTRLFHLPLFAALLGGALACGAGEGTHGGGENLPTTGILPHVALEEPLLSEPGHDLRRPWVVETPEGIRMWIADRDVGSGETDHIQRHDSASGWSWSPEGTVALEAAREGWEAGSIDAPCVVRDGDAWRMYYTGGDGAGIGLATSDDGKRWVRHADNPVLSPAQAWESEGGVTHASVLPDDDGWVMWYAGGEGAGIGRATSEDGVSWQRTQEAPVFTPSGSEGDTLWDRDAVLHATITRRVTATGRELFQMWYGGARLNAANALDLSIGYAGSFDGIHWERFKLAPVLHEGGLGESEAFPISVDGHPALLYTRYWKKEGVNRRVLALAFFGSVPVGDD